MLEQISVLGLLFLNAEIDYKKKEISLGSLVFFGIFQMVIRICTGECWSLKETFNLLPGLILLLLSWITEGKIGMGDAFLLLALGIVLPVEEIVTLLIFALLIAVIYGCLIHRNNLQKRVAFVPFLLLGYVGGLCLGI